MYLTIYDLKKELDKTPPTGVTTVSNTLYRKVLSSLLRTQTAARSLIECHAANSSREQKALASLKASLLTETEPERLPRFSDEEVFGGPYQKENA